MSTSKQIEQMLQCPVCQETLREPQSLSCFHSFCSQCLKRLDKVREGEEDGVPCPVCRAFTASDSIKASFLVKELLELHTNQQSGADSVCEQCLEKTPQWKCLDCKITLCKKCQGIHLRVPLLRGHRVLPIDAETELVIDRLVFCTKHADQPIVFNCRDCEAPLCIKCKVTQHESHKTETIEDTLERILPEVSKCVESVREHIADIDHNKEYIQAKIQAVKEEYSQCRKQLKKALDAKQREEVEKLEFWLNRRTEYAQLVEWVETCNTTARGVSLMGEIQTGLFQKLKHITASMKVSDATFTLDFPELKAIGTRKETGIALHYHSSVVFKHPVFDGRLPSIPYTDIFSKQLVAQKEIQLKERCNRIAITNGNIWAPIPEYNLIQVFDISGEELPSIELTSAPRSVVQEASGRILVASDTGIVTMTANGTLGEPVPGTTGAFSDLRVQDDKMVAINYNQNAVIYFKRKNDDTWQKEGNMPLQYNANNGEDTLLVGKYIHHTCLSQVYYYIVKYNDQYQSMGYFKSSQQQLSYPRLVGTDTSGQILIADYNNARFQLFNPDTNEWQLLSNSNIPHGSQPLDLLYDYQGDVWVLSSHPQPRIVKYGPQQE